ncbi:hypothetical protein BJX63DRAFT_189794 [Aspergillus granulosus]|uniref:Uncharacterized protein n=1 Tax=Aspergillus granulosus TaxID=176169 RepID=A0ABR4HGY9_9EURO
MAMGTITGWLGGGAMESTGFTPLASFLLSLSFIFFSRSFLLILIWSAQCLRKEQALVLPSDAYHTHIIMIMLVSPQAWVALRRGRRKTKA